MKPRSTSMSAQIYQVAVRMLVTGGLLLVIYLCGVKIWRMWFDRTLVLIPFRYTRDGQLQDEEGRHFTSLVGQDLARLGDLFSGELAEEDTFIPSTDQIGRGQQIELPVIKESLLPTIEIQAYGIQFSTLFQAINRFLEQPNDIAGTVTERSQRFDVYAELRNAPATRNIQVDRVRWYVLDAASKDEASFSLASRIFRLLLVQKAPLYEKATEGEFVTFVRALRAYETYRARLAEIGRKEDAARALAEADSLARQLSSATKSFPFAHKLAAYTAREKGELDEARQAVKRYLEMLKSLGQSDKSGEDLLALLEGKQPYVEVTVAKSSGDLSLRARLRPIRPGASVGTLDPEAMNSGTICCLVEDLQGQIYVLTADHVLPGPPGAAVAQPAILDGGTSADQVATLVQRTELRTGESVKAAGALAGLLPGIQALNEIPGVGRFSGIASSVGLGERVRVVGRTTGLAEGTVMGIKVDALIAQDSTKTIRIEGLIQTTSISGPGDSGAPVLNMRNELVGMIYAGTANYTFVMPIEPLLRAFNVKLMP